MKKLSMILLALLINLAAYGSGILASKLEFDKMSDFNGLVEDYEMSLIGDCDFFDSSRKKCGSDHGVRDFNYNSAVKLIGNSNLREFVMEQFIEVNGITGIEEEFLNDFFDGKISAEELKDYSKKMEVEILENRTVISSDVGGDFKVVLASNKAVTYFYIDTDEDYDDYKCVNVFDMKNSSRKILDHQTALGFVCRYIFDAD